MDQRVFVIGNGMTKFLRPGRPENPDYPEMGRLATQRALNDAGIKYSQIDQAVVGYVYGDSTCGQRAIYDVGISGIPIYNVNNNCATGSTAIHIANSLVAGNRANCVLALGFDKMFKGSLGSTFKDRTNPLDKIFISTYDILQKVNKGPFAPQIFGNAGIEHMEKYGTKEEHFAKIAWKNHLHSSKNPYSQFKTIFSLDEIKDSPKIYGPLTKLQCCPTSDGAGAAILCNLKFVIDNNLQDQAVEVVGISLKTDTVSTFEEKSLIKLAGYDMSKNAAKVLFLIEIKYK